MARRHTKRGYTTSDVIDWQMRQAMTGCSFSARTTPMWVWLDMAAKQRLHAMDEDVCPYWQRIECIRSARDSLAKARAWRMEIAEPRAA